MAGEYFRMGQDLASAYHRGLAQRRTMDIEDAQEARRQQEFDLRVQGLRRTASREREVDDAFGQHAALAGGGVVEGAGTGLSQPSMQMLAAGGTGYGEGEGAVVVGWSPARWCVRRRRRSSRRPRSRAPIRARVTCSAPRRA